MTEEVIPLPPITKKEGYSDKIEDAHEDSL